jgi:hypothetical protein
LIERSKDIGDSSGFGGRGVAPAAVNVKARRAP